MSRTVPLLLILCLAALARAEAKGDPLLPPVEAVRGMHIEINAQRVSDGESRLTSVKGAWGRKGAWFRLVRESAPPARIFLDEGHWWVIDDIRNCREQAGDRDDLTKVWAMPDYLAASFIESAGRHLILVEQGAPAKGEALDSYRLRGTARMGTGETLRADVVFEVNRDTGQVVSSFGTLIEARAELGARKLSWTARVARAGEIQPVVVPPPCEAAPIADPVMTGAFDVERTGGQLSFSIREEPAKIEEHFRRFYGRQGLRPQLALDENASGGDFLFTGEGRTVSLMIGHEPGRAARVTVVDRLGDAPPPPGPAPTLVVKEAMAPPPVEKARPPEPPLAPAPMAVKTPPPEVPAPREPEPVVVAAEPEEAPLEEDAGIEAEEPETAPVTRGCDQGCGPGESCFTYPAFAGGQSVCLTPCATNADCTKRPGTLCNCSEFSDACRTWFDDAPEGACVPAP